MDSEEIKWKPLSLTFVEYPEDDPFGKFLAYASLFPIAMIVGCFTLILFRRDLHTISFFIGSLLCELLNLIAKKIIREPRPLVRPFQQTDFGMPSSHSQICWFFAIYSTLFILFRLHHNRQSLFEGVWKVTVIALLISTAVIVMYSRVYLLYHSWTQVFVGAVVGILLGASWFFTVHILLTPYFPFIASLSVCELLMIRDTSLIPNILWFEYTHARSENGTRNRKLACMKTQ